MPRARKTPPGRPRDRFAVVAARFNAKIVDRLLAGAWKAFREHGIPASRVTLVRVPGSLELPIVAQRLARSERFAAIVCLGAVIRGETDHYDYVCSGTVQGLVQVGLTSGVPTIVGVLTCRRMKHARARAGGKEGNKGYDAALAAIEMAQVMRETP
jgi:6,7-dimethyl-8-ribityllumazine synthase